VARISVPSKWQVAVLAGAVWAGVEYFRAEIFTLTFPWITPGTGLPPNWLTPIFGVYGVTFFIILGNALLLNRWKHGLVMLFLLALGVVTFPPAPEAAEKIRVGLVQDESAMVQRLRAASKPFVDEVDAVVWPEYSLGNFDDSTLQIGKEIASRRRVFVASGLEVIDGEEYNTAFVISADGILGRHVKNHPVHFFSDGVAGTVAEPVATQFGKVGTPVCFDCDHQDVIRRMTAGGAEFFLIPSLDAMEWSARQHEQHGALFRHRAAENGRWLAVASSSGVTQIIDARGRVRDRIPLMEEGVLIGEIGRENDQTIFQRGGWLIGPTLLLVTLVLIPALIWRNRQGAGNGFC
jgi:apolipoprotein N-acyltransferase